MITKPKIIKCDYGFHQDSFNITPKMILVIENKRISEEDIIAANIDYENTNPYSVNNIANFFNREHSNLIKEDLINNMTELSSRGYSTNNFNFAYHYLIDKKGNIYEGRHKNIPVYNLDIFDFKKGEYSIMSPAENLFKNFIVIMTEENTDEFPLSTKAYNSLNELIRYILKTDNTIKEYFCYNEIRNFEMKISDSKSNSNLKYNNPGLFFPTNILRSSVTCGIIPEKQITEFKQTIYTYGSRTLIYNQTKPMIGNDVIQVQYLLYNLGYFKDNITFNAVTGEYDYDTSKAISDYQFSNGIKPLFGYGQADKNTLNHLFNNKTYKNKIEEELMDKFHYTTALTPDLFRILKFESEDNMMMGEDVIYLQKLIKDKILYSQNITGFYDPETVENVKFFQSIIKVNSDGSKIISDGICSPYLIHALEKAKTLKSLNIDLRLNQQNDLNDYSYSIALLQTSLNNLLDKKFEQKITGTITSKLADIIKNLNKDPNNRKLMNIDNLTRNGELIDWSDENNLYTCFIEEYEFLIKNYLNI